MRGVLLLSRSQPVTPVEVQPTGRILNAQQFATEICGGHVSAKYVIKHFAEIGSKPGREWLWHEGDARAAWAEWMPRKRMSA